VLKLRALATQQRRLSFGGVELRFLLGYIQPGGLPIGK